VVGRRRATWRAINIWQCSMSLSLPIGLNHMNGRVEDAILGRMISPDPHITDPTNAQNYNRYSYVGNNPLTFRDPTGFKKCDGCGDDDDDSDGPPAPDPGCTSLFPDCTVRGKVLSPPSSPPTSSPPSNPPVTAAGADPGPSYA
jgi:RHS repeat-associated protein